MSIMVGVGRGARAGILIKSAEALERMERVDTLVIDKTGTLTEGKPKVVAVTPTHGLDEKDILRFAAAVESRSEHPIAHAIVAAAAERGIELPDVRGFNSPTGKGVVGMIERHRIALGSAKFLGELGIAAADLEPLAERLRQDGATAIFLAVDGKAAGVIAVADPVRETALAALKALKRAGIRIVMLTGDSRTTADAVAKKLGIDEVIADVLPEQKVEAVRKLRAGAIQFNEKKCDANARTDLSNAVCLSHPAAIAVP
jgi:Cu+-exporting ATPase